MSLPKLGEGGFGVVYLVDDKAAKTPFSNSEHDLLKLCQGHSNVIQYIGVKTVESREYLLMERMWMSLYDYKNFEYTVHDALAKSFARQLLSGLAHIHSKGVVHCDIKPSNVMFNKKGYLRIVDFGSACKEGDRRITIYDNCYRPPEAKDDTIVAAKPQDIWAAACVIGEMFCGKPPKPEQSVEEYLLSMDKSQTELLQAMMHIDPSKRLTATQALSYTYLQ